jgi:hypothetical protein
MAMLCATIYLMSILIIDPYTHLLDDALHSLAVSHSTHSTHSTTFDCLPHSFIHYNHYIFISLPFHHFISFHEIFITHVRSTVVCLIMIMMMMMMMMITIIIMIEIHICGDELNNNKSIAS